eukprot:CAMPEP_0184643694 /NCGR_PEP_ID=MMETSP0308-20130426/524_1 /TAXON_ID=38269 /ORGANISM="Gloeochaete witrockiana, Strain SAG 46.84" /LENGTH=187 /DNA_ID=CAMNT_0027071791 /DNA_START=32 /DNA_END=595 /DNA_ORIENTATION=+
MRLTHATHSVDIPEGVTVTIRSREVTVVGPRGTLNRSFKHLPSHIHVADGKVVVEIWFGDKKHVACVRTICSHINNLILGVTKGFEYKMRLVYAHFPVSAAISDDGKIIQVINFLGEKINRTVHMLDGVTVRSSDVKDEIVLTGNDLEKVSQSASKIHHIARVKEKDIRKFLDGVYVSQKGCIGADN